MSEWTVDVVWISMNKRRESTASIEESEEEIYSEHGSTTDAENEEINYWESLTTGILPFPAPLRLQSLLFIIGHLDEYGNETLALLPLVRGKRYYSTFQLSMCAGWKVVE